MRKLHIKHPFAGQGMVEFALVLPVLLMIILGLIAVGHLIFTYSFVLSSSREAARYGAAAGIADNGKLRFQDCDGIIGAATRVGGVAGVKSPGVSVAYDKGPDENIIGQCVSGGTGPTVQLGDRITVDVVVPYRVIVPLINFPEFDLRASTSRTIVRDITVGKSPDSIDECINTVTTITQSRGQLNPTPVVGEPVIFSVDVVDIKYVPVSNTTGGVVLLDILDDGSEIELCRANAPSGSCTTQFFTSGDHYITARYYGHNETTFCLAPSEEFGYLRKIDPANTKVTIRELPNNVNSGSPLPVTVDVVPVVPGAGYPTGTVNISVDGVAYCTATLENGTATCTITLTQPMGAGNKSVTVRADYTGDGNYQANFATAGTRVLAPVPSPTLIYTSTPMPTPTMVSTPIPQPTARPCPSIASGMNFTSRAGRLDELVFSVRNNDPTLNIYLSSVSLSWPDKPLAKLQEVRFAPDTTPECKGGGNTCIWANSKGLDPTSVTLNSGDRDWVTSRTLFNAGQTNQVRMIFSHNLPNGDFSVNLSFSNLCTLSIDALRNVTTE